MKLKLTIIGEPPVSLPGKQGPGKPGPGPGKEGPAPAKVKKPKEPKPEVTIKTGKEVREEVLNVAKKQTDLEKAAEERIKQAEIEFQKARKALINAPGDQAERLAEEQLTKAEAALTKAYDNKYAVRAARNEKIRETLYIDSGPKRKKLFTPDPSLQFRNKALHEERKKQLKEALDFLNRVTAPEVRSPLPDLRIVEQGAGERAATSYKANRIFLSDDSGVTTLLHETGHNLEYNNPEIYNSATHMYAVRTQGEVKESLKDVTGISSYEKGELTKKDKFFTPYMGKLSGQWTEITSSSLGYLYSAPEELATKDPETFEWIVNVLRGKYV